MKEQVLKEVAQVVVGDGLDAKTTLGPVISAEAKSRIEKDIEAALSEGAELLVDGTIAETGSLVNRDSEVKRLMPEAEIAFNEVGLNWKDYVLTSDKYHRPNEVNHLLGDPSKAQSELGWKPKTTFLELVRMMVDSDLKLAERDKVLLNKGLISKTWED